MGSCFSVLLLHIYVFLYLVFSNFLKRKINSRTILAETERKPPFYYTSHSAGFPEQKAV